MASKKGYGKSADAKSEKCAFQVAVELTEEVKNGFCFGKQAIKHADRNKVHAADSKKLQGSLDIDSQVKTLYPHDPRWDYAVSYDDKIYFFEIHPAETSEVGKVISKVQWLKDWLKIKATKINELPILACDTAIFIHHDGCVVIESRGPTFEEGGDDDHPQLLC